MPHLSPQESEVLDLLASKAPDVVPLETVERRLWSSTSSRNASQRIREIVKELRSRLGDSAENPSFIETVVGVGYTFVGTVDRPEGSGPIPHRETKADQLNSERSNDEGLAISNTAASTKSTKWHHFIIYIVLLLTVTGVGAATSTAAYGMATLLFCFGGALATLRYIRVPETISARVALGTFFIAAMSYIPSAVTLTEVTASAVNATTIKPAIAYPFITGLKFIPLFVVVFFYWVLLLADGDLGLRKRPRLGRSYIFVGALFLAMTGLSVASGSGDYLMFEAKLPGYWLLIAGYGFILSVNVAVCLFAYRFFNKDSISGYRRLFFVCGIAYLPLALVAIMIDHQYNYLNQRYLDKRRPEAYVAANPSGINSDAGLKNATAARIGPDLASLLNDPAFREALRSKRFYKQDFDELFQVSERAVMFGYKPNAISPRDIPAFVIIRFPKELANLLRFQAVGGESNFPSH